MLERMQLFPLNFYKKAKFNGSMGKMNYRLAKEEKKTDEENSETILVGSIWEGPFIYDKIPQERSQRENSHLQKKESVRQWTGSMRKAKK